MSYSYRLLCGDVLDRLRELPDESVHCVVTSPPYFGLRDYGTATWINGDPNCDHKQGRPGAGRADGVVDARSQRNRDGVGAMGGNCKKCGAVRLDHQIGLEKTPEEFVERLVVIFREVRRVLRKDGVCWVNMGDSYAGSGKGLMGDGSHSELYTASKQSTSKVTLTAPKSSKPTRFTAGGEDGRIHTSGVRPPRGLKAKDLMGMPWRLAFALQADGWWLRQDIIWSKPNPMPESVSDRCTKAHEYIFLLTKRKEYFYDAEAIKEDSVTSDDRIREREDGKLNKVPSRRRMEGLTSNNYAMRNKRSVWEIGTEAFPEAHFATFPTELVKPCVLAGTSEKGCCEKCGAPQLRITKKVDTGKSHRQAAGWAIGPGSHGTVLADEDRRRPSTAQPITIYQTVGWKASCSCRGGVSPCTVLDPFSGAGTTALVALRYGRNAIGIELNADYIAMSETRIRADAPLFNHGTINFQNKG